MSSRLFALVLFAFGASATAAAQQQLPEVIRGRVTNDSGRAVIATVVVTRGPDRLTQTTSSDSAGNYRVRFEEGTGDYLVYVASIGLKSARRSIQREGTSRELVANFVLAVD